MVSVWLRRYAVAVAVAALAWLLSAGAVLAAGAAQENEYDPEGNLSYLFAVFAITWAAFFAYAFYMGRRQRELRREIDDLKEALQEKDPQKPST